QVENPCLTASYPVLSIRFPIVDSGRCHHIATTIEQLNRGVQGRRTQMHVALGHAQLAMASEFLNRPRRCALHCQMRAERMGSPMPAMTISPVVWSVFTLIVGSSAR